jgi:hypothetical protein
MWTVYWQSRTDPRLCGYTSYQFTTQVQAQTMCDKLDRDKPEYSHKPEQVE